jgi:hypothetical protein
MEGIYVEGRPPRIILSSLRPPGRMVYTCAHELGHHVFGHGTHVDEQIENGPSQGVNPDEEYLAECFGGFLLMPKLAVSYGFAQRRWDSTHCNPEQVYVVATWLGVGYKTLVTHMAGSLGLLPWSRAEELGKVSAKQLRKAILGEETQASVIVVDDPWCGRPIDVQIGDIVVFRSHVRFEGTSVMYLGDSRKGQLFRGAAPGITRCWNETTQWAQFIRVSRKDYVGQSRYRHLEEPTHA